LIAAAIAGAFYWWSVKDLEWTDDAFIDGHTVALTPRIEGTVARVLITDNQPVKEGELLIEIDGRDREAKLADARAALAAAVAGATKAQADITLVRATTDAVLQQARSNLALAQASLRKAEADVTAARAELQRNSADAERYRRLAQQGIASGQRQEAALAAAEMSEARLRGAEHAVSVARASVGVAEAVVATAETAGQQVAVKDAELATARANVAAAEARMREAEINLSYTRIAAPHDGVVTKKSVAPGAVVRVNQTLASLVYGPRWVIANFKETQLARMRPGQAVEIKVDAYPDVTFTGRVDSIQRGTGAYFSLLPPENATGNFVKVVQRVPVKIVFDDPPDPGHVLSLGMSVIPTVRLVDPDVPGK
jgi:membrane fusion protein (multidrug efflux system)